MVNKDTLKNMLTSLADSFAEERQKEEPYKELFRAGSTHTGLLRNLESQMVGHILDVCNVYKERHGIKINTNQFHMLLALPLLAKVAEKDATQNEGSCCCVDKAFFILSEQLKALGEVKQEAQP